MGESLDQTATAGSLFEIGGETFSEVRKKGVSHAGVCGRKGP